MCKPDAVGFVLHSVHEKCNFCSSVVSMGVNITRAVNRIATGLRWKVMLGCVPVGSIHKLVALSFPPSNIILLLYHTVHYNLSNLTLHPALVNTTIPNRDAIKSSRMMCPVRTTGSPLMWTLHICVDVTCRPLARDTARGFVMGPLLITGVPSIMNICVAPESAIASLVLSGNAAPAKCGGGGVILSSVDVDALVFDVTTVLLLSSTCVGHTDIT